MLGCRRSLTGSHQKCPHHTRPMRPLRSLISCKPQITWKVPFDTNHKNLYIAANNANDRILFRIQPPGGVVGRRISYCSGSCFMHASRLTWEGGRASMRPKLCQCAIHISDIILITRSSCRKISLTAASDSEHVSFLFCTPPLLTPQHQR